MAKRQVENTIFEEVWFMELPLQYKMLMLYFFITSDHAGLGNLNFTIINTLLGYEFNKAEVLDVLSKHIREYKDGKYQIIKFMEFHYNDSNKSQVYKSAIKRLKNEGLVGGEIVEFDMENTGLVSKEFLRNLQNSQRL